VEKKIQAKDEILAELTAEHVSLQKKRLGNSDRGSGFRTTSGTRSRISAHRRFPSEEPARGYRRVTFMMLDADIVAVGPSSVWQVLNQAGLLSKRNDKPSTKGTGFTQPLAAHQHWRLDVSCLSAGGTFYYLCSIPDSYSRFIGRSALIAPISQVCAFLALGSDYMPQAGRVEDWRGIP
jgi:hypothetical protein